MTTDESASRPLLVLVVEDSALVALDLEQALLDAGLRVLGPGHTASEALRMRVKPMAGFRGARFQSRREHVTPVALRLRELGIPFVLTSAYPSVDSKLGPSFEGSASRSIACC